MNKTDLIDRVATQLESTKSDASRAVEAVIEAIARGVRDEQKVTIAGFGTFVCKERKARMGVNPTTKEPMPIAASKTCGFRPAPALKESL
ncbi:MAG: HU family DNA-binding protein [Phycisphaerales bacterium JB039]